MRNRVVLLWLALNTLAFIFCGQNWWVLIVNAASNSSTLAGTGFDSDRSIAAVLLFDLAALLFVSFSRGYLAVAISATAGAASLALMVFTLKNIAMQNIGSITVLVEKHSGLAISSFLEANSATLVRGELQPWAWASVLVLALLSATQVLFASKNVKWSRQTPTIGDRTKRNSVHARAEDPITLWDDQKR